MAERINRSHNKLQEWGLKGAAIIALGAAGLGLVGCGNEKAGASHTPETTASASATPGSNESSPTPSETTSSSPETANQFEMGETKLANSKVYNELSKSDQAEIEKNSQLSLEEFEKLAPEKRAMVALVLSDAHSAEYIKGVGTLVMPGNYGQPLNDVNMPALNKEHQNVAQDLYDWVRKSTPNDLTASNNGQPYFDTALKFGIAGALASSGDPKLLNDAKKIVGGTLHHGSEEVAGGGVAYDQEGWGNFTQRMKDLDAMSKSRKNTLQYFGYPNAGTDRHRFVDAPSGPFQGKPAHVALGFEVYDPTTQSMQEGANSAGITGASYQVIVYTGADGRARSTWTEYQTASDPLANGVGPFEQNAA